MDSKDLQRYSNVQDYCLQQVDEQLKKWNTFQEDYCKLKSQLESLPDEVSYGCMVPFGKKAFMPGKLIHTNEILVLLGDNWFVETSAKKAAEIVSRRLCQCREMIEKLHTEREQYVARHNFISEENPEEGAETMDISETITEEEHEAWLEKHRANIQKEKSGLIEKSDNERMNEFFQQMLQVESDENRDSSSSAEESNNSDVVVPTTSKSVHWSTDTFHKSEKILFKHSDVPSPLLQLNINNPADLHPGCIQQYFMQNTDELPVSILKRTAHDMATSSFNSGNDKETDTNYLSKQGLNPYIVSDIVERETTQDINLSGAVDHEPSSEKKHVSLFRAGRSKRQ